MDIESSFLVIDMEMLPSSICNLRHLQSLDLHGCDCLEELPEDLGNLRSLIHLLLDGCAELSQIPPGLAALTSLVTLDRLVVHTHRGGLRYLECLDNLSGSLEIVVPKIGWKNATTDAERSFLSRKSRLTRLSITRGDGLEEADEETSFLAETWMNALQPHPNLECLSICNFGGNEMPHWIKGIHNLVILKLEGCEGCVELPPLSHLQFLKELHIDNMSSMLTIVDNKVYEAANYLFFPSLETLWIENVPNLTGWWLQPPTTMQPAFPRVTKVHICKCPKLTSCMPLFPVISLSRIFAAMGKEVGKSTRRKEVAALQTLNIDGVSEELKKRCERLTGEDWPKIQHIQKINMY